MTKDEALNKAMFMATNIRRGITPSIADAILLFQACKEALEQPAQEPVAKGFIRSLVSIDKNGIETWKEEPFYTSPPSWQGLSDDEIFDLHHKWIMNSGNKDTQYYFARAIEQALKEKNHG